MARTALSDTLTAVRMVPVTRHLIALDGEPGDWLPDGIDVIAQQAGTLDERIAAAMKQAYEGLPAPVVLVGMDAPQAGPGLLTSAVVSLARDRADAVSGPAADSGFWSLGLRRPDLRLLLGVPMSSAATGAAQLVAAGLRVHQLSELTDVDTAAEAAIVAMQHPGGLFAGTLRAVLAQGRWAAAAEREPAGRPQPASHLPLASVLPDDLQAAPELSWLGSPP